MEWPPKVGILHEMGNNVQGVFRDQLKLDILFFGIVVGRFKCDKWGDHQKKKLFINNAVKAQILFKENHQCLMRLHAHLEGISIVRKKWACLQKKDFFLKRKNDVWQNLLKPYVSFGGSLGSSSVEREPCENLALLSMYEGNMETVEYTWCMLG